MKNKSYSKMVAIFALVLAITTSLWTALPATLCFAQGGYEEVEGGGGGGLPPHTSYISLSGKIDYQGELTEDVTAKTPDELCQLTINEGTKALKETGYRLTSLIIAKMKEPPAQPPNAKFIGSVYDLAPDGATLEPPATLTLTFDPDEIPEGVSPENLVIAMWEEKSPGEWVNLVSTVDTATNTVSASVSHFTAFTVIASTQPAAFTTSYLVISLMEVDVGEKVNIRVKVTNTGDLTDSYEVTLKIDKVVVATQDVTLAGGASQTVTFTASKDVAGTYNVNVNGLTGTFVVKAIPAPPPAPAPAPPPAPAPAPPPAPAPAPPAPPPMAPPTAINWWLIGGIIGAVIVISIIVILVIRRRWA